MYPSPYEIHLGRTPDPVSTTIFRRRSLMERQDCVCVFATELEAV